MGQRRTLGLAGMKEPFYVLTINAERNEIVAGPRKHLMSDGLTAGDMNWIVPFQFIPSRPVTAKIRSTAPPVPCEVAPGPGDTAEVRFTDPQESVTPGQSVVFYSDDIVVGGGTIRKT